MSVEKEKSGSISGMNTEERKAWAALIREARVEQGLDQETLAEMVDVTRQTISNIETGRSTAQPRVLERILTTLGLWEPVELDQDVKNFLALIGPLLQQLPTDARAEVMPDLALLVGRKVARQSRRNAS